MSEWQPDEIVRVARSLNPAHAHIYRQALQDEGIRCKVVGDNLEGGFGDLIGMSAEIWVHKVDADRADKIIKAHERRLAEEEE